MSTIVPPTTPLQVPDSLSSELSDVTCQYSGHTGDSPARWAVWFRPIPCGHWEADFLFFCDPCWEHRNSWGEVTCLTGAHVYPSMFPVVRVEHI